MGDNFRKAPREWLVIAFAASAIGLLALASISAASGPIALSSRFTKQFLFLGCAILVFIITFRVPKRILHRLAYWLFGLSFLALFLPYLTGPVAGTYRWVEVGGIGFQPAELMKWALVLALARYLSDHKLQVDRFRSIMIPLTVALIPTAVIAKQPDLGSAVVLMAPVIPMAYWVGASTFHIVLILLPLVSMVTAFNYYTFTAWILLVGFGLYRTRTSNGVKILNVLGNIAVGLVTPAAWNSLRPYQQERILVLLDTSRDPQGAGYQVIQSQTAIGSGGLFGKGWGEGTQSHLKFLPEQETDFIFSAIGEEFGFLGVIVLLALFFWLIIGFVRRACQSDERFSSLVLIGLATLFLAHVFINIGMTINLLPVKGLPLPFVSYGGSFLISCFAMLGLAMNMAVHAEE